MALLIHGVAAVIVDAVYARAAARKTSYSFDAGTARLEVEFSKTPQAEPANEEPPPDAVETEEPGSQEIAAVLPEEEVADDADAGEPPAPASEQTAAEHQTSDAGVIEAAAATSDALSASSSETPVGYWPSKPEVSWVGLSEIKPRYPFGSRVRGEEGVVKVNVRVNPSGRCDVAEVVESSGFRALDKAALDAVRKARFVAEGGAAKEGGEVVLTFRFRLTD